MARSNAASLWTAFFADPGRSEMSVPGLLAGVEADQGRMRGGSRLLCASEVGLAELGRPANLLWADLRSIVDPGWVEGSDNDPVVKVCGLAFNLRVSAAYARVA
jgi:hypothetical protein